MTLSDDKICNALSGLIYWLERWKSEDGAYNGFIIHRSERKRMKYVHDTAWTQAAIIRGYCNLYRKSGEKRWYDLLIKASDLQADRFDAKSGKFFYAGHEDDRFCSLVHCALANSALLEVCELTDEQRKQRYLHVIKNNVQKYWFESLWVESEGAFRFNDVDYYSPYEDRYVINCNCIAVECLLKLSQITNEQTYSKYALRFGDWLIEKCSQARYYYAQLSKNAKQDNRDIGIITKGGLPYQYTPSQSIPDNCVCLYAGLALRGIASLAECTGNTEYNKIANETTDFMLAMRDPETKLFYHTTQNNRIVPFPQFISGAGMPLVGLDRAKKLLANPLYISDTVEAILTRSYKNGAYPSFVGKNASPRRNKKGSVWEDVSCSINWNSQWFEYLTRIVNDPKQISISSNTESVKIDNKRFIYKESSKRVSIVSWWPWESMGMFFIKKGEDKADFTLDIPGLLRTTYQGIKDTSKRLYNASR